MELHSFRGPLLLTSGAILEEVTVNYQVYGQLNSSRDNAILVCHALTAGSLVASVDDPEKEPGWWDPLVGPGRALDTNKYFIICSNVLGGCYGTTGPASTNPKTGCPYAMNFPVITIRDMVHVQKFLLDHLKIKSLKAVIGGSLGGMQALEWAVTYPHMVEKVIAIACSGRFSSIGISFNEAARRAIMNDPHWRRGRYYGGDFPRQGLALARLIATITYRSRESFEKRFGRLLQEEERANPFNFFEQFAVESYLNYQANKLVRRFDANSYLYLTKAMDLHDLGMGYASFAAALRRIRAVVYLLGISSDILFYPQEVRGLAVTMRREGVLSYYEELKSPHGHDAFLIEFPQVKTFLRDCLSH
ncbi:MAG: homoserine O-acetyltransferase [Firmicutes bacterium]|nr:homoserine O-acetyltransferase [Bacillota bacterium]